MFRAVNDEIALFRDMLRIRMIEEAVAARYNQGHMRCPVHLSIGQEAMAVGVCAALRPDDQVLSNHRCHAHYLAKGGDLTGMLAEMFGRATGCCGGRGGSMHLHDQAAGMLVSSPIVGGAIPLANGVGMAMRMQGRDSVAVVFFGDGACEEGVVHESLNFASHRQLPVLFVVENNFYSVCATLDERQPDRPLEDLAKGHAVPSFTVDGNDVFAVHEVANEAVARARRGEGPSLIVGDTYRWMAHSGPIDDIERGYRTSDEVAEWRRRCPVERARAHLAASGTLSDAAERDFAAAFTAEIDTAFATALAAPFPARSSAGEHVYA